MGSSAISSFGDPVRASAIATRCAIPPDSWCAKRPSTDSGSGIPTRVSSLRGRDARGGTRHLPVSPQRFDQKAADREARIERDERVLCDVGDLAAAHVAPLRFRQRGHVVPVELDTAGADDTAVREHPENGTGRHRLAASGLAHERDRFAGPDGERDVVEHDERLAGRGGERDRETLDDEQPGANPITRSSVRIGRLGSRRCRRRDAAASRRERSVDHGVTDEVEREDGEHDREPARDQLPRRDRQILRGLEDHRSPRRSGRRGPETEKAQAGDREDPDAEPERQLDDHRAQDVRQHMPGHDARGRNALCARRRRTTPIGSPASRFAPGG